MARTPDRTSTETECCPRPLLEPLDKKEADDLASAFAALADPVRLRLLSIVADAGECCACDLLVPLGKSQPTISHHTKVLADAGILHGDKRGRWVWWSVDRGRVRALRDALRVT
ncbi:MAG: metalloregulator ArsR/SmtB family transcription factor [Actinomycetota bacterium]|nr:metalloregulator ArsR/SmtB family transcription factor [Actinomycetota bacterium]